MLTAPPVMLTRISVPSPMRMALPAPGSPGSKLIWLPPTARSFGDSFLRFRSKRRQSRKLSSSGQSMVGGGGVGGGGERAGGAGACAAASGNGLASDDTPASDVGP